MKGGFSNVGLLIGSMLKGRWEFLIIGGPSPMDMTAFRYISRVPILQNKQHMPQIPLV